MIGASALSQALDPPTIDCVNVTAAGAASITWSPPADPNGEFVNYEIYSSTDNVNFALIASINNYATTNFVHATANADNAPACYYIVTNSNDGTAQASVPSATACSIFLQIDQSNPVGFAELTWGTFEIPSNPASEYVIQVEYPLGTWTTVETIPVGTTTYDYEVSTCGEFLRFRVGLDSGAGCNYNSNSEGDFFDDTTAPEVPAIISVDVDSISDLATIEWEAAGAGDTDGYIVYQCLNGFTLILDTLWGQFNTVYTNTGSTAAVTGPESYTVASFDTCLTGVPPSPNTSPTSSLCQRSMYLEASWFPCSEDVNISWTPYEGWQEGVSYYEIYAKADGNAPQLLGINQPTQLTFVHEGITPGVSYTYFIKAFAALDPYDAISNTFVLNTTQFQEPSYVYLSTASVEEENLVRVDLHMQSVPENFYYNLQRLDEPDDEWETIFTQVANSINYLEFFDVTAKTNEQSYTYRIKVDNECGDSVTVSNTGETIFLSGVANSSNFVNTLNWNKYFEWDGGVSEHEIHRTIDRGGIEEQIATINSNTLYYEDDVVDLLLTPGEFCYRVMARENNNFLGFSEVSWSNEICLTQEPKIWIPNAFIVYGVNNEFKPVISFADFENYRMIIYNRWGDVIFETTDIEEGWDGRVNGDIVQEGQYMYYISIADGFGGFNERRGSVLMLVGKD